jgi:hypothetical protein
MPQILICTSCNLPHISEYAKKCLVCWKRASGFDLSKADLAHERLAQAFSEVLSQSQNTTSTSNPNLQAEVNKLQAENKKLDAEKYALMMQISQLNVKIYTMEHEVRALRNNPPSSSALPQDKIKDLISLCHPDRHGNSALATQITQWLLSIRKK